MNNLYYEKIDKQKRKIKVLESIAMGLIAIVFLVALWLILSLENGLERFEINECNTWKEQAEIYPNYYLLEWQEQQCNRHGIKINAPVAYKINK